MKKLLTLARWIDALSDRFASVATWAVLAACLISAGNALVESKDIYMGSLPFIVLKLVLVAVVIAFPQTVTALLDKKVEYDLDKVEIPMTTSDKAAPDTQVSIEELFKSADKPASAPK